MSERIKILPKNIYGLATRLFLISTFAVGGAVYTSRQHDGPAGVISLNNLNQGDLDLSDINNPEFKIKMSGSNIISEYALSPDGQKIVYTMNSQPQTQVYVENINGTKRRLLTPKMGGQRPSWSPDGKKLVFMGYQNSNSGIWVVDLDGENPPQRITKPSPNTSELDPSWSSDGKKIVYIKTTWANPGTKSEYSYDQVWLINGDGTKEQAIAVPETEGGRIGSLSWSPNGKEILFTYGYSDQPWDISQTQTGRPNDRSDIYKMNIDTGEISNLTPDSKAIVDYYPLWSPDGEKIVFQEIVYGKSGIYAMNSDGSDRTLVLDDQFADNIKWTHDGKGVAFSTFKNGGRELDILDLSTSQQKTLLKGETDLSAPVWWPPKK